jgi:hypothetical protein
MVTQKLLSIFGRRNQKRAGVDMALRPVPRAEYNAYCPIDPNEELRQSEIISNLTYYSIEPNSDDPTQLDTAQGKVSYAIIATPDCDLLQAFKTPGGRSPTLLSVLFFAMEEEAAMKQRVGYGSKEWKHVKQNEIDRFYFIHAVDAQNDLLGLGIPDAVVDFKRYFTLPPREVLRQCSSSGPAKANRRCRLTDMWRQDMQQRAMSYMQRVALPDRADERPG